KFPAPAFTAATKLELKANAAGERAGLVVMGNDYTYLCLEKGENGSKIAVYTWKRGGPRYSPPQEAVGGDTALSTIWFKARINDDASYAYTYSLDGKQYSAIGSRYKAEPGVWIGAKVGVFCMTPNIMNTRGYADFDFFRIEKP